MSSSKSKKPSKSFFMTIDNTVYSKIYKLANKRGLTVQQYIRAVILPEWINFQKKS